LAQLTPEELAALLEKDVPTALAGLPAPSGASGANSGLAVGAQGRGAGLGVPFARGDVAEAVQSISVSSGDGQTDRDYDDAPVVAVQNRAGEQFVSRKPARQRVDRRAVAPMAKRLLRLLLTHPELVDVMGEQQLELLERSPNLEMVRELIVLAQASGARHVGALIQASDPGADLGILMASVAADLMAQDPLPNPQGEWEDALRRIELDSLKNEQEALIAEGLNNLESQRNYRELSSRITRLMGSIESNKIR
jgi:DNA primase